MNVKKSGRWIGVFLGLTCSSLSARNATVEFLNNDRITGDVKVLDDGGLGFKSYWMESFIPLPLHEITRMELTVEPLLKPEGTKVMASGGSQFWLQNLHLTETTLKGHSALGGNMDLPMDEVQQVFLSGVNRALEKEATSKKARDPYLEQRVYEVAEWPEKFFLEIHISESQPETRFQLHAMGPERERESRFLVRVDQNVVMIYLFEPTEKGLNRPQYIHYPFQPGQHVRRIRLMGDLSSGDMQMKIGEGKVVRWKLEDPDLFQSTLDQSAMLILQNDSRVSHLDVSTFRLIPWGGLDFPNTTLPESGILSHSGDYRKGNVLSIADEQVAFLSKESGTVQHIQQDEVLVWSPAPSQPADGSSPLIKVETRQQGEMFYFQDVRFIPSLSGDSFALSGKLHAGSWYPLKENTIQSIQYPGKIPETDWMNPDKGSSVTVRCLNGDSITGTFLGIEDSALAFRPAWSEVSAVAINGAAVETLSFPSLSLISMSPYLFRLRSDGVINGELTSLTENAVEMITQWGQPLQLDPNSVQHLERRSDLASTVSLLRPDLEGWSHYDETYQLLAERQDVVRQTPTGWYLKEGEYFVSTNPVPSENLSFVLRVTPKQWEDVGTLRFEIRGFPDAAGQEMRIRAELSGRRLRVDIYDDERNVQRWARFLPQESLGHLDLTFSVLGSSDTIQVKVGDEDLWNYAIPHRTFASSPSVQTVSIHLFGGMKDLKVNRLLLLQDPSPQYPEGRLQDMTPGQLVFTNGDQMEAQVVKIEEEKALFRFGESAEVPMSMNRISHMALPESEPFSLRRKASHARFTLQDGQQHFLAEVMKATPQEFMVRREGVSGVFTIPVEVISTVELNPYFLR